VNVFPLRFGLIALAFIQWILMRGVANGMALHPINLAISKGWWSPSSLRDEFGLPATWWLT